MKFKVYNIQGKKKIRYEERHFDIEYGKNSTNFTYHAEKSNVLKPHLQKCKGWDEKGYKRRIKGTSE